MDIVQKFYDNLAPQYDNLFLDWNKETFEQALILRRIFTMYGFENSEAILDCACGIGTQAIGLARLGYDVTASDISEGELKEAKKRAENNKVNISFAKADFRKLSDAFEQKFNIILAMDNALPHMLTKQDLEMAIESITERLNEGGIFVASIRDYDEILKNKPPYSPPYIHKTEKGKRLSFQTWEWNYNNYKLTQYIINDEETLKISKFDCEYRAIKREELTNLLLKYGCSKVDWLFPQDSKFYQPLVVARK